MNEFKMELELGSWYPHDQSDPGSNPFHLMGHCRFRGESMKKYHQIGDPAVGRKKRVIVDFGR